MSKTTIMWLFDLLSQVWDPCQEVRAVDNIGKDKLDSIFGRFIGDVHPKWTPPPECQQLFIEVMFFPDTYNFLQL